MSDPTEQMLEGMARTAGDFGLDYISKQQAEACLQRITDDGQRIAELEADVTRLRGRIDSFVGLVAGLDRLLAHYRTHSTPSGALLDRLAEARRREADLFAAEGEPHG